MAGMIEFKLNHHMTIPRAHGIEININVSIDINIDINVITKTTPS